MKTFLLPVFFVALFLSNTSSAFAISNEALVQACGERGRQKVADQAESFGCQIDASAITVQEIDNRWYNPSKYIWFTVPATCPNGLDAVTKMVQYYGGKCI